MIYPALQVDTPAVYGLVDPCEPGRVRYVGRSVHPFKRYTEHCAIGPCVNPDVKRGTWIQGLVDEGRNPVMVLLQAASRESLPELEGEWVHRLKAVGQADLNWPAGCCRPKALQAYLDQRYQRAKAKRGGKG